LATVVQDLLSILIYLGVGDADRPLMSDAPPQRAATVPAPALIGRPSGVTPAPDPSEAP